MRMMLIGLLAAGLAGSAAAQPGGRLPEDGLVCMAPNGAAEPALCRRGSDYGPSDICLCPGSSTRVDAPICAKGEKPPAETVGLMRARRLAARDGSLYGDTYEGHRMCVKLPNRPFARD